MKKDFFLKFYIFCFVEKLYLNFDVKKHVELKKCTSKVINFSTVIARCRFNVLQKMRGLYLIGVKRYNASTVIRAGNSLIRSFAHFAQIKWATVSDLLRSLKTNEQLWANRSGRSEKMSNRERFAQKILAKKI